MFTQNKIQQSMEYTDKEFCLEVWGPMACFTRPELKVERVSYDVITPSAARAIFEAIFWKPAIHWQVTKIEVLNPIKWVSIRRNELKFNKQESFFIEEERTQRNTLLLADVRYRIYALLKFISIRKRIDGNGLYEKWYDRQKENYKESLNLKIDGEEASLLRKNENPAKYNAMFERRARMGQCFKQPYFGIREFEASYRFVPPDETLLKPKECYYFDKGEINLGIMFYDWDFSHIYNTKKQSVDYKKAMPLFYKAVMNNGIIIVPPINSQEIIR